MKIQPEKTKDRAEAEGKNTVRERKKKQQLETFVLLQEHPPTFHAGDMQDFRCKSWSQKENMFFRKLYLEALNGWEKGGKQVWENKKKDKNEEKKKKKKNQNACSYLYV